MRKHIQIDDQDITIEPIEIPDGQTFDPVAFLEQVMHDCPECRAARARGEVPLVVHGDPFAGAGHDDSLPAKRDVIRDRRPRWRDLKRKVRR